MEKKKEEKENIFKSSFFRKLFIAPSIIWIIISLISMIPDSGDSEEITWFEFAVGNISLILIWFAISFIIVLIVREVKKIKSKTKIIKEIQYIENADEKMTITTKENNNDKKENFCANTDKVIKEENINIKDDNKDYLYLCESKLEIDEFIKMLEHFPKIYWAFVVRGIFINLVLSAIVAISLKNIFAVIIFFIVYQIYLMIYYKINFNRLIEKQCKEEITKRTIDTELQIKFYDDYLVRQGETITRQIKYSDIDRCVENENNFYLLDSARNVGAFIQKDKCEAELINFIRKTFDNLENYCNDNGKVRKTKKYENPKFIKSCMHVLFILTIASIWFSALSFSLIEKLRPHSILSPFKNMWVFFLWLPMPILSIILGFKFNKKEFHCTRNIVAGFVIGALLLIVGSMSSIPSLSEDYNKIDEYRNIMDVDIPNDGELAIYDPAACFDEEKKECTRLEVYYSDIKNNELESLVSSIESNNNWFLSKEIKSKLKIFISHFSYVSNEDVYFSIYNKTTDEYNELPKVPGVYEIYVMRYDKSIKYLEINKFKYTYK